ncbi:MAG: hypothetical protein AB7V45_04810 [Candidatus Krumholzibacteriia bacterium]
MNRTTNLILLAATAGAAFIFAGCTDEGVITAPDPGKGYPEAVTPDLLVDNLVRAYAERAIDAYALLLDEDFAFTLRPCDVADLGLKSDHWGKQDELAAVSRMFSGRPHVRDDGTVVPAVTAIEVEYCLPLTGWEDAGDPDRDGVQRAVYDLRVRFMREEATDLMVSGPSTFFAVPVADPRGAERYRLLGWIDQSLPCD